jgi:hypothetical protein
MTKASVMILYYFIVFGVAYGHCHKGSVHFHPSRGFGGYFEPESISQEDIGE